MRQSPFAVMVKAAAEEARSRGDRRVGTEHLLLGMLRDPSSDTARALAVSLEDARGALHELDRQALSAIGVHVGDVPDVRPRKHPRVPLTAITTSARAAINQALKSTTTRTRSTQGPRALLLVLLEQPSPDPVSALVDQLGLDRARVRSQLA
ncbi:MAG: hypothetical protein HOY71_25325 [Nonomuraea sp.]|nr:hypothetical protein [Nonomuraea sp.]